MFRHTGRTFLVAPHYWDMPTPIEAAGTTVQLSKRLISEQEVRIRRQQALIGSLQRRGRERLLMDARTLLERMLALRHQMQAERFEAQKHSGD